MSERLKPELLVPAGNLEKLKTAVFYGADAVYVGVPGLSLRAGAAEMSLADLAEGIGHAHVHHVKVYGALNTFARNADLAAVRGILPELAALGIDALIVSDPGIVRLIRALAPDVAIHLSTQANTTNAEAVRFWREHGVKRIVLARELSLSEIAEIAAAAPDVDLEVFVHGAMCMAYSGRCFLSDWRNSRSANRGDCTQPCRWEYRLVESTRPDDPLVVEEDDRYTYLLSSKDLCLIEYLPDLVSTGIASLKIEGRMKSSYYVAMVSRTYRQALDAFLADPTGYQCDPQWLDELTKISNRGYTTGFAFAEGKISEVSPDVKYHQTHEPAGTVLEYDAAHQRVLLLAKNYLAPGQALEILLPRNTIRTEIGDMTDVEGNVIREAHAGNRIWLPLDANVPQGALVRKRIGQGVAP